jgi:hypothetical protein
MISRHLQCHITEARRCIPEKKKFYAITHNRQGAPYVLKKTFG